MKKLFLLAIIATSFIPLVTLATSGVCSDHNGINCAASPGAYGQIVCNDGWTGSSMLFNTTICPVPQCIYPITYGCKNETDLQTLTNNRADYLQGLYRMGESQSQAEKDLGNSYNIPQCQKQITEFQQQITIYNNCQSNIKNAQNNYINQIDETIKQIQSNTYCLKYFGNYAQYDSLSGQCTCQAGYMFNIPKTACIPFDYCFSKDPHSVTVAGSCYCFEGYTYDKNTNSCLVNTSIITTSTTLLSTTTLQTLPILSITQSNATIYTKTKVNIRANNSAKSKIIGMTKINQKYQILNEVGAWTNIQFNDKNGWILKNLVIKSKLNK